MRTNTHKQNPNIDVGLAVLCSVAKAGETLTQKEISEICSCSRNAIFEIEKRALRKAKAKAIELGLQNYLQD